MRQRDLTVLPIRVQPQLKESIRDLAQFQSLSQAEVIRRALHQYVLSPIHRNSNKEVG